MGTQSTWGVSKRTLTREQQGTKMGRIRLEEVTSTNLTLLRDINQKIFPILTVTDMSANQWSQFVKKDSGFAFLAYWNDMLAGAVCCQLTDNNGLYLRFIGTLNRHRRKGVAKRETSTTSSPMSGMTIRQRSTSTRSLGLASRAMTRETRVFT